MQHGTDPHDATNLTGKYEILNVAERAIQFFDVPQHCLNEDQTAALRSLSNFLLSTKKYRDNPARRFNWADGPKAVSVENMTKLLGHMARIFFPGELRFVFEWKKLETGTYGQFKHNFETGRGTIYMDPEQFNDWVEGSLAFRGRAIDRIDTMLHELTHAYIRQYACRSCPTWPAGFGEGGHGPAFCMLARKLAKKAYEFWGLSLSLGRY